MKTNSTKKLIQNLNFKGIKFRQGEKDLFKKNDYFQIINAYKSLFVANVEVIDDIINNIDNNTDLDRYYKSYNINNHLTGNDLKSKICDKILNKYDKNLNNTSLQDKIEAIKKFKYIHHIYGKNTYYGDFVRMQLFEHDLRSILLKNTLLIEENIKRIFISILNDMEVDSNYLADINNYNLFDNNVNKPLDSIKKILSIHENEKSNPIKRKTEQSIIIPYWILINEMTLNQTITTINNLKIDIRNKIFQQCVNEFSLSNIDIYDKTKTEQQINDEKKLIYIFSIVLKYIGSFRNLLAHNQPIFNYNVKDTSLINYPKISYSIPSSNIKSQNALNMNMMRKLQILYGIDFYNKNVYDVNINLSWMIYVISRIINILYKNNKFADDIREVYKKYNIILSYGKEYVFKETDLASLLQEISQINSESLNYNEVCQLIDNKKPYKSVLKNKIKEINTVLINIRKYEKLFKYTKKRSDYPPFTNVAIYKKYTNIDLYFLNNL